MRTSPVVVIHTQPETVHEDARRALRLCTSRRAPAREGALVVFESGHAGRGVTSAWALRAIVDHLREAHVDRDRMRVGAVGAEAFPTAETALDRAIARLDLRPEALQREGSHTPDVEVPWLRGRRGTEVGVDPRVAGRDLVWAGPLRPERRHGWRGAVDGALSLVARDEELEDADPQTLVELHRLFEATVAGAIFLLDATVCPSADGRERPQVHNLILAGRDPIAVEAVAARVLGYDPERVTWLRALAEGARRDISSGGIEVRGGFADDGALRRTGGRALPARARAARHRDAVEAPRRWFARWNLRRWDRLYARTPWGRLREHERRAGASTPEGDR